MLHLKPDMVSQSEISVRMSRAGTLSAKLSVREIIRYEYLVLRTGSVKICLPHILPNVPQCATMMFGVSDPHVTKTPVDCNVLSIVV